MRSGLRRWGWAALDLLAPPNCVGCGRIGSAWCSDCSGKVRPFSGHLCPDCGGAPVGGACPHCALYPSVFNGAMSYAPYTDPFKQIVLRLKHQPDLALGALAAELICATAAEAALGATLVLPVPLGTARLKARGYNQVDLFGRPLADALDLPYAPRGLTRRRETRSQVGLTGEQRRDNLADAFRADPGIVGGCNILLLDDVFTTGSTGNACAVALRNAGAGRVFLFTLARAVGSEEVITEIA